MKKMMNLILVAALAALMLGAAVTARTGKPSAARAATVTVKVSSFQFTPKTVETEEERQKLMFRIKAHIAPELLRQHIEHVKTGLPGMAYVQLDPAAQWPGNLNIKLTR